MTHVSIIANTPCMPKQTYHCGNAISQLISDVLAAHIHLTTPGQRTVYVAHAWNLHGKPFEDLYSERTGAVDFTYDDVWAFASPFIEEAVCQKSYIATYPRRSIVYNDTHALCCEFAYDCFARLAGMGYIRIWHGECILDLAKFFRTHGADWEGQLRTIQILPAYHRSSIINHRRMLGEGYPLTKGQRIFTPRVRYLDSIYALNPIFQSLIAPAYLAWQWNASLPVLLQVSASGHGMLKWHYLRSIVCYLLARTIPYQHLVLHGSLLGTDGQPMSKHANNCIQPSDVFALKEDRTFVRYVLLKSISEKDIPLQVQAASDEYTRIAAKLRLLSSGAPVIVANVEEIAPHLNASWTCLGRYGVKQAFEHFYLAVKRARLLPGEGGNAHSLAQLYAVFLQPEREQIFTKAVV